MHEGSAQCLHTQNFFHGMYKQSLKKTVRRVLIWYVESSNSLIKSGRSVELVICVYWKNLLTQVPVENPINSGLMITLIAHSAHHQYVIPNSPTNMSSKHYEENFLFLRDRQLFASNNRHPEFLLNVFVFLIRNAHFFQVTIHVSAASSCNAKMMLCIALWRERQERCRAYPSTYRYSWREATTIRPRLPLNMTHTGLNEITVHRAWHTQAPQVKLEPTEQISSIHVKATESFCKYCRQNVQ